MTACSNIDSSFQWRSRVRKHFAISWSLRAIIRRRVRRALPIIPLLVGEARKCQSENNDAVMEWWWVAQRGYATREIVERPFTRLYWLDF